MLDSVFVKAEFFSLIATSIILPFMIFSRLNARKRIRRGSILLYGLFLISLGAIDVVLLKRLAIMSLKTPSLLDDYVFASEISAGLYLLPVISAGIGVNLLSHVLIGHLERVEDPEAGEDSG
jgi:hypothetical protein